MKLKLVIVILYLAPLFSPGQSKEITTAQYQQDFNFFWTSIAEEYCYFHEKQTDWLKVKENYLPVIDTIKNTNTFIAVLERVLYEIYDHHASLNTNTSNSQRLVPSGADIWAEYINGKAIVTEIRKNYGADAVGIFAGMEVVSVNDIPVQIAMEPFMSNSVSASDNEAKGYALRLLLAGNHIQPRKIALKYNEITKDYYPDKSGFLTEHIKYNAKIETKLINGIGYIKINDCLYNNELITEFDSVMQVFRNTISLILDFRETPGGGNTSVAKAILGWFIDKDHFYQKHEYYAEEKSTGIKRSWVEIVSSRGDKYYSKPIAILCNHWTGSIAEGIVIGFDALKRPDTKIIGTEMARLRGAVYTFEMPNSKIRFSIPTERLYHINGTPREQYIPPVFIDWRKGELKAGSDVFMEQALQFLKNR